MRWIASFVLCGQILLQNNSITSRARALSHRNNSLPSRSSLLPRPATTVFFSVASASASSFAPVDSLKSGSSSFEANTMVGTGYLNAVDAAALDEELMSTPGFSLEQLMELAGLAVAEAVYQVVAASSNSETEESPNANRRKILLVCGPGNNGGDGLVAARHLTFFGNYECTVVYPKRSTKQHFVNLVRQCEDVGIPILDDMPSKDQIDSCDAIVDAIFGFSFKGVPREPFGTILRKLKEVQEENDNNSVQIISVDVPSGWNVDEGDVADTGFVPDVLISLTTPKLCSKEFQGRHFIGGRFLPPRVASKYNVQMPPYPGVSQVMEVTREQIEGEPPYKKPVKESSSNPVSSGDSWREEYADYLAEQAKAAIASRKENQTDETINNDASSEETWEMQYAAYCAEKEARLNEANAK